MKSLCKLLMSVLVITLFLGCYNSEDFDTANTSSINQENSIKGNWNLTKLQGGFEGSDNSFGYGEITWIFNDNDFTITVNNTIESENITSGLSSGVYNYSVINDSGNYFLIIENVNYGKFSISSEDLILDQNIDIENNTINDAMMLFFER